MTDLIMHAINTGNAAPIRKRCYNQSPQITSEVNQQIDEQLTIGLIEESNAIWNLPIVIVKKKDGSLCTCVDYRKLNLVTEDISYPLPTMTVVLDTMGVHQPAWCTLIDMRSAYSQVK